MKRAALIRTATVISGTVLFSACVLAESLQVSAGYALIGSNFIPGDAQIVPIGMSPTTFDNGLLTVSESVKGDPSDPNSQWVTFNVQPTNAVFSLLGASGMFEIPLSILPLNVSGDFTGFETSFTNSSPSITFSGTTPISDVAVLMDVMPASASSSGMSSFEVGVRVTSGGTVPSPTPAPNPQPTPNPSPGPDPPPVMSSAPEPGTASLAGIALILISIGVRRWRLRNSSPELRNLRRGDLQPR
jgi:hypothetical protein